MTPSIIFVMPKQPRPTDRRPRNAFGFLKGFGRACSTYYQKRKKHV